MNIADQVYCVGRGLASIRARTGKAETKYLRQQLLLCLDEILRFTAGSTFANIDRKSLENFFVLIPPMRHQLRIAQRLERWDETIKQTENLIASKVQLKSGLKQKLLTGKTRFQEFANLEWSRMKISDFTDSKIRIRPRPETAFTALGIRSHGKGTFLKPYFDPSKIEMLELFEVKENDLIVNITFAWEGAIAIVGADDAGALVSHRFPTYEFNPDFALPEFFRHVITQKWFIDMLGIISPGGAGRNRVLNKRDFEKLEILMPSVGEQRCIAKVLDACNKEIELLRKQLDVLKLQKRGLMQKLLTGQIRVKVGEEIKEELTA